MSGLKIGPNCFFSQGFVSFQLLVVFQGADGKLRQSSLNLTCNLRDMSFHVRDIPTFLAFGSINANVIWLNTYYPKMEDIIFSFTTFLTYSLRSI